MAGDLRSIDAVRQIVGAALAAAAALLAGCAWQPGLGNGRTPSVYQDERFQPDETFSRLFDAGVADTCEAARRALLSQGYVVSTARPDVINGSKRFQPEGAVHMEISFTVVCVPEGAGGAVSTAYVSAQQDRYVIKRASTSAGLGVGALGSISVPLSSSEESLVKVGSETIPAGPFYDRYFALMQRLLADLRDTPR
ncbi:MAG: DUF2242 domain-containing protein [Piscinibacter sp.]|uniref:DUF2242 domain-containing protein n=1 Tax=Piscinibacter sp. TaxID=1903157 RepID=UPI00258BB17A|nr:DUF2242 domain-containing protein [Piscinibacter sp.]MCW5665984.1 DUF2242 domain-containing protein [Piscinibacter sp.]